MLVVNGNGSLLSTVGRGSGDPFPMPSNHELCRRKAKMLSARPGCNGRVMPVDPLARHLQTLMRCLKTQIYQV